MDIDHTGSGFLLTKVSKLIVVFAGIIVGLLLIRICIVPFTVSDSTMLPNFNPGERTYFLKLGPVRKGDVVLIDSPIEEGRVVLKRILAVEGEVVEVKNREILVNGKSAEFSWKTVRKDTRIFPMSFSGRDNFPALKLKRGEYFVIGDNLDYAMDSRFFGAVRADAIIGKHLYTLPFQGP